MNLMLGPILKMAVNGSHSQTFVWLFLSYLYVCMYAITLQVCTNRC